MALIDEVLGRPGLRQALWRWWYPFFTRRVRAHEVDFLNYAYEESPPMGLPLPAADEAFRANIQLYHHVAQAADLRGARVRSGRIRRARPQPGGHPLLRRSA